MERTQCLYENEVEFNLSESGVLPLRVEEVLQNSKVSADFLSLSLKYPESDGSEANFTALWGLLEKGDHAAVMLPNYLQTWGLSRAYAARTNGFYLVESREHGEARWALDVEGLRRAVSKKTRLIVVTNPNNPTGAVLNQQEMDEIVRVARKARAWLLVDEIYRGAEVNGPLTSTFWGSYDKVLITSG